MRKAEKIKPKTAKGTPARPRSGRPQKLQVDEKMIGQVEAMAGLGLTMENISLILGVGQRTLCRYKKDYPALQAAYQRGRSQGAMTVVASLRKLIEEGNVSATIFYLKTQCRWSEKARYDADSTDIEGAARKLAQAREAIRAYRRLLGYEEE